MNLSDIEGFGTSRYSLTLLPRNCRGVRNLLREGGFDWGPIELDELWVELVERAVRKKFRKPPNS